MRRRFALDRHAPNSYKPATAAFLRIDDGEGIKREAEKNGFVNLFEEGAAVLGRRDRECLCPEAYRWCFTEFLAMDVRILKVGLICFGLAAMLALQTVLWGQAPPQDPSQGAGPAAGNDGLPPVPQGLDVQTRGPVHEAFATPAAEPAPTQLVPKEPPKPLQEMPPEEKPEGNVAWIGGYWSYDEERKDFLWVSGTWRTPPPGKRWVAGYWRPEGDQWQWVPGMWAKSENEQNTAHEMTYMPAPPAPPAVAPPAQPPTPDAFYVPGAWGWHNAGYVMEGGNQVWHEAGYAWTAGYWARVQPGYVWVQAHYRWTPSGYVYIPGYWDLAVGRRGMLYTPVYVDMAVVGPGYVYTPAYAVPETVVVDSMFIRPAYCHYYYGDYYGPAYGPMGFEACIVYSRSHYDAVFVYERWDHRADPRWESVQFDICIGRGAGRYPCPPRAFVGVGVGVGVGGYGMAVVVAPSRLAAARGTRMERLDMRARMEHRERAEAIRHVAMERSRNEVAGIPKQPRAATLHVPPTAHANVASTAHAPVHPAQPAHPQTSLLKRPTIPQKSQQKNGEHKQEPGGGK
ncbi:MAG TPA: YXWGXW repeat-containing protein [Gemmataceae bacterium]|nr:YXWGXW repeat-containing protein [Gemmataceae bacterium]